MVLQIVIFVLLLILAVIIPLEHIFGKRKNMINTSSTFSFVMALFLVNILTTAGNRYDSIGFLVATLVLIFFSFIGGVFKKIYSGNEFNIPDFETVSVEKVFQKALDYLRFPEYNREVQQENKKVKYIFENEKYTIEFNTKKYFFESGYYHTIIFKNSMPKEMKRNLLEFMEDYLKQQGEPQVRWRTRIIEAVIVFVIVVGAMGFMNYSILNPKTIEQIYTDMPDTIMIDKYDPVTQELESVTITDADVIDNLLAPVDNAYAFIISNTYLDEKDTQFTYRLSIPGDAHELYYQSSAIHMYYNYDVLSRSDSLWMKFMVYINNIYSQKDGVYYYLINDDTYAGRDAEAIISQYFN